MASLYFTTNADLYIVSLPVAFGFKVRQYVWQAEIAILAMGFFQPTDRIFSYWNVFFTTSTVNILRTKLRSIALVHSGLCIYFCFKLIDGRWSPSNRPMSLETVLNVISKSIESHKRNPMSINFFIFIIAGQVIRVTKSWQSQFQAFFHLLFLSTAVDNREFPR
jgi:hypothetical protein